MPRRGQDKPTVKTTTKKRTPRATPKPADTTTTTKKELTEGDAGVSYSVTITKNTGNYENIKVQAGITIPLGASKDTLSELDKLLITARETVTKRVSEDLSKLAE